MVISTGRIVSWPCVRALNSLQKAMMLIPWGPSAVPTGGAGGAFPAGVWRLTNPGTFLAMTPLLRGGRPAAPPTRRRHFSCQMRDGSVRLELQVVELDRGGAAEQGDAHAHLPLVRHDF